MPECEIRTKPAQNPGLAPINCAGVSKLDKFRRNPTLFFADSRFRAVRALGFLARPLLTRPGLRALLLDPMDALMQSRIPLLAPALRSRDRAAAARRAALFADAGEPKISVIMAAWNAGQTLPAAAASILSQSYKNLELIIVDDASSDDTLAIARDLARAEDRVRVLSNPRQRGAAWSRNRGLSRASGDFITFQDADDISHPERLERQLAELLRHPAKVVCLCNSRRQDGDGNVVVINGRYVSKAVIAMLFRYDPVFTRLGYWVDIHVSEDAEYYERIRAVFGDDSQVLLAKILYFQRFAASSLLFSDGVTTAGEQGAVSHARSAEAEADLARQRERHERIRRGRQDPYVAFDPES